ncbi:putative transposase [Bradyrhizobiaceae bacterium SG-6C]|nr:putative transposase [Bradyrhizobiaceae bacterium SG-6C]
MLRIIDEFSRGGSGQREPAAPANILTPAALTLRHAPIADCARYDNLRRTV